MLFLFSEIVESLKSRCLFWLCGIHSDKMVVKRGASKSEELELARKMLTPTLTDRTGILLVNISAVICLTIVTALFAFFG